MPQGIESESNSSLPATSIELAELTSQERAMAAYTRVLRVAYDNPFVTLESRKRRSLVAQQLFAQDYEPNYLIDDEGNRVIIHPFYPTPFVFGSVARGQARADSDTDVVVIHDVQDFEKTHPSLHGSRSIWLANNVATFPSPFTLDEVKVFPASELVAFCPAIGEFADEECFNPKVQESAYLLRKRLIAAINHPATFCTSEQLWNRIRRRLSLLLLSNLTSNSNIDSTSQDGVVKNRRQQISDFRINQLIMRAPNNQRLQNRIMHFFYGHDQMSFPDWETMKLAFGVE